MMQRKKAGLSGALAVAISLSLPAPWNLEASGQVAPPEAAKPGDDKGWTPLIHAVDKNDVALVKQLLDGGADVHELTKKQSSPLDFAANRGRCELIRLLVQHGAKPNGESGAILPLSQAARGGHADAVKLLCDLGADPNAQAPDGSTPLFSAAWSGDVKVIEFLLQSGARWQHHDANGFTPLMAAVMSGNPAAVQVFIKLGADPADGDSGHTPLCTAAAAKHWTVVEYLLSLGVPPDSRGRWDEGTVLELACRGGNGKLVRWLIAHKARASIGSRHLVSAAAAGSTDCLQALFEAGFAPEADDLYDPIAAAAHAGKGQTTLLLIRQSRKAIAAAPGPREQAIEELFDALAKEDAPGIEAAFAHGPITDDWLLTLASELASAQGDVQVMREIQRAGTASRNAAQRQRRLDNDLIIAARTGDLEKAQRLLSGGANADAYGRNLIGLSPLFTAVEARHKDVVALLLQNGARFPISRSRSCSPFVEAIKGGDREMLKLFTDAGADLHAPEVAYASWGAAFRGSDAVLEFLLDNGLDVNNTAYGGETPLMAAARAGKSKTVQLLLKRGAKGDIRGRGAGSDEGMTAYDFAVQGNFQDTVRLLAPVTASSATSPVRPSLRVAIEKGPAAVKAALAAGADPDAPDEPGATLAAFGSPPLVLLCSSSQPDRLQLARLLLEHGAHVTPAAMQEAAQYPGADGILAELLKRKGDPDRGISEAPLATAVRVGNLTAVQRLIAAGASLDVRGEKRESLGDLARKAEVNSPQIVKLLQDAHARLANPAK